MLRTQSSIRREFKESPSVYAETIPSQIPTPFDAPDDFDLNSCHICKQKKSAAKSFDLRLVIKPRAHNGGYRRVCLDCTIKNQGLFDPGGPIQVGMLLAIHPYIDLTPKKNPSFLDKSWPAIKTSDYRKKQEEKIKRTMGHVKYYALVTNIGSEGSLEVETWSDDRVSKAGKDTLARSSFTGDWWSMAEEGRVTVRRSQLEDEKRFLFRFNSSLLRGGF